MVLILSIAVGCFLAFAALPALLLLLYLNRHRVPVDFDAVPSAKIGAQYIPHIEQILKDIKRLKSLPWETVSLKAGDGTELSGLFCHGDGKIAVLLHGYNSTPFNNFASLGMALAEDGWSLLMPYMRGHGPSGGRTAFGIKEAEDALRWAEWASETAPQAEMIVCGMSMGGACVNFASAARWPANVKALIVDSGYYNVRKQMYSMPQMDNIAGKLLIPLICLYSKLLFGADMGTDTLETLGNAALPMCFIEGTRDKSVKPQTVEKAYEACASDKKLIKADAEHTLAFLAGGEHFRNDLFSFINDHLDKGGK